MQNHIIPVVVSIFELFLGKFTQKSSKKHENQKNKNFGFDNSIKNHMDMPETGGQVIWSDLDPLNPGKK